MAEPNFREFSRGQRGRRDERPIPVRSEQTGERGQRRAYEYQQKRAIEASDWVEQRDFEERPDRRGPGKPSSRSTAWKEKQKDQRKKDKGKKEQNAPSETPQPIQDFRAKKETPESEPTFDVGYYQASVPVKERYTQNSDHGGFIPLTEGVYEEFVGIDNKTSRTMPYSAFLHCMCNVLNAHLMDVDPSTGGRPLGTAEYASDLFGGDALIPAPIYDYLQCYSQVVTSASDDVWPNLPPICVPSPGTEAAIAGTFGRIRVQDHNKYECYIAPYVTAKRVEASYRQREEWQPLPDGYFPADGVPNSNLLGYGPIDLLTNEGKSRLHGITYSEDGSVACRLRFSSELFKRVQTYLKAKSEV